MLACAHHWSWDLVLSDAAPFLFYWGLLFYGAMGLLLLVGLLGRRGPCAVRPGRYLLAALPLIVFFDSFLVPLLLLGPLFLFRAGRILGARRDPAWLLAGLRVVLLAALGLTPAACLRVGLELYPYLDVLWPTLRLAAVLLTLGSGLFLLGRSLGRREARAPLPRRWALDPARAASPRAEVHVQEQQGCPLCWEVFLEGGATPVLRACPGCGTVVHADCAWELGGCPTLGCRGRRPRPDPSRAPARASSLRVVGLAPRPGRRVSALAGTS